MVVVDGVVEEVVGVSGELVAEPAGDVEDMDGDALAVEVEEVVVDGLEPAQAAQTRLSATATGHALIRISRPARAGRRWRGRA